MIVYERPQVSNFDCLRFEISSAPFNIFGFETTIAKMKDFDKQTPENTMGGGTTSTAYRRPNGDTPRTAGDPLTLPPGTSSEKFKDYTRRAAEIVGEENVVIITDPAELSKESYLDPSKGHDMYHVLEKEYFISSAVVAPKDIPDVQAIMRLANEFDIPVWPFSIGRNVGYGGAGPRVSGSVGIDLGRHMKKVLSCDVDGAYMFVEPGVTFFDAYDYLVKNNLRDKLWLDVPDLGGGSIIGNAVERGVGYTPYGDHWSKSARSFTSVCYTFAALRIESESTAQSCDRSSN